MRPWIWITAIFALFVSSSVFGNYGQMKKALDTYQPPTIFSVPETAPSSTLPQKPQGIKTSAPDASAWVKTGFKTGFKTDLAAMGQDRIDPEAYSYIKGIAGDETALVRRLGQKAGMDEIKAVALLRNPEIRAAGEKVLAQIQSFDQVMNLDDQLRRYNTFTAAVNTRAGPVTKKASVKMDFPSPGLTALKGKIVENSVSQQMSKAAVTIKTVIKDVETIFRELDFIIRSIRITRDTIAAFERLKDVATVLYRSGKTSFQDVIKINIKLEELKETLVTLASEKKTVSFRLCERLDLPWFAIGTLASAPLPATLPVEKELYALARVHRQELAALRFQIDKVAAMVEMAETMTQARATLGFSFNDAGLVNTTGTDAPQTAFATQTMAAMGNNSPARAWYGINAPWLAQTRKTLSSLKSTLKARENATNSMVRQAWFKADKNHREHLLYRDRILPMAQSALDVATREYEAGSIPFSQAIGSYTDWLKVQLTIARKNSDFGTSFAELEYVIGKPLR